MLKLNTQQTRKFLTYAFSVRHATFQQPQIKPNVASGSSDVSPVFRNAINFSDRIGVRDSIGSYSYANLYMGAKELSKEINTVLKGRNNEQVLFVCPNDANYVLTQWAIWMSGDIAVPVSSNHPRSMVEYYVKDSNSKLLITTPSYAEQMHSIAKSCDKPLFVLDEKFQEDTIGKTAKFQKDWECELPSDYYNKKNAMIIYTGAATGNPKGVVLSHKNITSRVNTLVDAWKWTSNDVILQILPLDQEHGIVNALLCPFAVGAKCNMLPSYDSTAVWSHLLGVNMKSDDRKITIFMAVPTVYSKLIEEYERVFSKDPKMVEYIKMTLKSKMRLMVSDSACMPIPLYNDWFEITGHKLLERYGMAESGVCFSQEYFSDREPGYVGVPLPGVSVRLSRPPDDDESDFTTLLECTNNNGNVQLKMNGNITFKEDPIGELLVQGDNVFSEYFNNPEATANEFTTNKWFKTANVCQYSLEKKLFKMLGRKDVDIIKTGGFKVSALEIETQLLGHPDIADCAVVGIGDDTWGEIVTAVIVPKKDVVVSLETIRPWAERNMTSYTIPRILKVVDAIPKDATGKVNKRELIEKVYP